MRDPSTAFVLYFTLTLGIILATAPAQRLARWRVGSLIAVLLVMLPLGHSLRNQRLTYPFVAWTMYSAPLPPVHIEYVFNDGRVKMERFPFRLIAFSSPWAFMARLDQEILRCRCTQDDPLIDGVFAGLAAIYREATGFTVQTFEAYEVGTHTLRLEERSRLYLWSAVHDDYGKQRK